MDPVLHDRPMLSVARVHSDRAVSAPCWCRAHGHGSRPTGYRGRLSENAATLAEVLQPAGYRTYMAGKWHVGTPDPTRRGFEQFSGKLISAQTFWDSAAYLRMPAGSRTRAYNKEAFYGTDALTDYGLNFLGNAREMPDRPWFLYLAYNSPHFPLQARRDDIAKYRDRDAVEWDALREERL